MFVPQITGEPNAPGAVILNWSVAQSPMPAVTKPSFLGLFQQSMFNLPMTAFGAPSNKLEPSVWVARVCVVKSYLYW